MTGILISVRNSVEVEVAHRGGADIIDIKEPSRGSLGAPDLDTACEIAGQLRDRLPVSLALGELIDHVQPVSTETGGLSIRQWKQIPSSFSFAKVGLSRCRTIPRWKDFWAEALEKIPNGVRRVAVAYADWQDAGAPEIECVMEFGAELGCRAVLLDTHHKGNGTLLDHLDLASLSRFIRLAHSRNMVMVLGGSIDLPAIQSLLTLAPDYLAVRTAACRGGQRNGEIDVNRVRQLVQIVRGRRIAESDATSSTANHRPHA